MTVERGRDPSREITIAMAIRVGAAMGLLAALSIIWYVVVRVSASEQAAYVSIMDLTARQRAVGERVAMLASQIVMTESEAERLSIAREISAAVESMRRSSSLLLSGERTRGFTSSAPAGVREVYFGPPHFYDRSVRAYAASASALTSAAGADLDEKSRDFVLVRDTARSGRLAMALDDLALVYENAHRSAALRNQRIYMALLLATLITLAATAAFLFAPMIMRVRRDVQLMRESESALLGLTQTLEERVVERTAAAEQRTRELEIEIEERRKVEKALRDNERKYQHLIESAGDAIISLDERGVVVEFNRMAEVMFGFRRDEIVGMSLTPILPDRYREPHSQAFAKYIREGGAGRKRREIRLSGKHRLGHEVPIAITFSHREEGGRMLVTAVIRDISVQIEAEAALREAERKYRSIVESAMDGIYQSTREGQFITVNTAMARMYGYESPADLLAGVTRIGAQVYVESETRERLIDRVERDGVVTDFESRCRRRDGSIIWTSESMRAVRDEHGRMLHYEGLVRDVTARKEAELALRESEARMRLIAESIDGVFYMIDDETGRVLFMSPNYERVWGRSVARLQDVPLDWQEAIHPEDRARVAAAISAGNRGAGYDQEYRIVRGDGEIRWIHDRAFPVHSSPGASRKTAGIAVDITERKLLEAHLAQSQKLEAVGQLAAGIAHEINTPIQFVGDNTRFLRESFQQVQRLLDAYATLAECVNGGSAAAGHLEMIGKIAEEIDVEYLAGEIPNAISQSLDGIGRITKIVGAMKEFTHPGARDREPVDLNQAIETTLAVAQNETKYVADVQTDLDPDLPEISGYASELNQVFLNVLINAVDAVSDVIGQGGRTRGLISVRSKRQGDWAEVQITDNGGGIPESIRHRVFDPFFTTKEVGKGTGQGLALSYAIVVEQHKGTIDFETDAGKGTTFRIRLPI